jgi:two-component system, OmpR family, sensor histidine kinase KdpD
MSQPRPDPDALLARVKEDEARQRRGKLKIFFGAAAGVGKTYAMLEAARNEKADGRDVVVGYVETHGRAETDALLDGLDTVPILRVPYHGTVLREMDLDAVLARKPAVALVDELAHTNAPGSRHAKRWQDVMELLDTGIDVFTTVNVQHVESLNDVVAKVTGVVVRETVPDSVLEQADEVELIDLPPDALLERFREGKVYVPAQAEEAAGNFFRKGNLIALRELALRHTADRVDAQMRSYMREHAIQRTWPVAERILVCVGPSPHSARLVRAAKRMADQLEAEWIVAYVETPAHAELGSEGRDRVVQTLRLAEQLGATTVTTTGPRMSDEILALARARNVTKIVVGKPRRVLWKRILLGSIVDALVEGSGEIDVYVISAEREEGVPAAARRRPTSTHWQAYGGAALIVAVTTAAAFLMAPYVALANLIMVYLLAVLIVATRFGRGPSLAASLLSVAAFNFFFVPPKLTFAVSDTQYLITFAVMLLVAFVISDLATRIRAQANAARERERRTAALYAMSRDLGRARGVGEVLSAAGRHIGDVFAGEVVFLLPGADGGLVSQPGTTSSFDPDPSDRAVARWVFEHRRAAGVGTATLPGARALYLPLLAARGAVGVLGVRPPDVHAFDAPEQIHQLETFANQTAVALERARLAEEAQEAEVRVEAERLRSSLLSSVSHDLRTPLTTITGAANVLLSADSPADAGTRRELLESVRDEADRLNRLVHNLLEMTRLESGSLQLHRDWHPAEEIVGAAIRRLGRRVAGRRLDVSLAPDLPLVLMDDVLVEQVLINLLDNALKYTPAGSAIRIAATASADRITFEVADHGPGLPPGEEERVFEKFYRGPATSERGAGLGLAISKGIVQAHGGRVWAHNLPEGGVAFFFTLPMTEAPPVIAPAHG